MQPTVVFLGVATLDTIALVDHYPGPDERVVVQALETAGGGPAATAAVACARLGVRATMVGSVGPDAEGHLVRAGLESEGIDASALEPNAARTGASVIIVDAGRATRAICNRPADRLTISPQGRALLAQADWVHVDQHGWPALQGVRGDLKPTARISVDAGNHIDGFDSSGVFLYVPTLTSLATRYGAGDPADLLRAAHADGAEVVVATDGSRGSYALEGDRLLHAPAARGYTILSTLGAGDVFHGALVAALVHGMDLSAALTYSNHVAAASCSALDGRSGIPHHADITARITQENR